ncbi:hypothetical protein LEP1GSC047_0090 [Leptospira inadai serovar Lyme str. 10]|uniref:Uncharacterized protein n=1 Tax=Leptospira inadai serovar Lyme str. 10 TaxID=1049790 RepID=V6HPL9_9LEPT|nr:hypothetical protein LEP1GSC047_0090 [Leptospira inadai serovar Lyme str. 10]
MFRDAKPLGRYASLFLAPIASINIVEVSMKIGLSIAGVILLLLIVFLGYMGAFNTVEVREEVQGPFYVISHHQTGEYRKAGETFVLGWNGYRSGESIYHRFVRGFLSKP